MAIESGARNTLDVVTFGEAMALLTAETPGSLDSVDRFTRHMAGAETNVATGLSRLGLKVGWSSRLGTDSLAKFMLSTLNAQGIDCSRVVCDPTQRTGLMLKGVVTDGSDPPVEYFRKGSAASLFGEGDIDVAWMLSARHLHATGIFPALSASCSSAAHRSMALMRAAGRTISFDPNLRPRLWSSVDTMRSEINRLAAKADWVFPGLAEGQLLTGLQVPDAIAKAFRGMGASLVVIKLGAEGAYFDCESGCGYVPGCPVDHVVDSVGAGDGFASGVISALLEGLSVERAVARGAWIGARVVQVLGDTDGLPTRAEMLAAGC